MTRVLVAVKRVVDSSGEAVLTDDQQGLDGRYAGYTIGDHDACAVELGIQVAEATGGSATIVSVGVAEAVEQIRGALALGAHAGVLVEADPVDARPGRRGRRDRGRRHGRRRRRRAVRPGAARQRRRRHRRLPGAGPARVRRGPPDRHRRRHRRGPRRHPRRDRVGGRTATRPTRCRCRPWCPCSRAAPSRATRPSRAGWPRRRSRSRSGPRPAGAGRRWAGAVAPAGAAAHVQRGDRRGSGGGARGRRPPPEAGGAAVILVMCEVDPGTGEVVEFSLESLALARSLSQAGGGVAVRAVVVGEVADRGGRPPRRSAATASPRSTTRRARPSPAYGGAAWAAAVQAVLAATGSVAVPGRRHPARHGGDRAPRGPAGRADGRQRRLVRRALAAHRAPSGRGRRRLRGDAADHPAGAVHRRRARLAGRGVRVRRRRLGRDHPGGRPRPTWSPASSAPPTRCPTSRRR